MTQCKHCQGAGWTIDLSREKLTAQKCSHCHRGQTPLHWGHWTLLIISIILFLILLGVIIFAGITGTPSATKFDNKTLAHYTQPSQQS